MAGVAQGDRIRSQDAVPLMRRTNGIEADTWDRGGLATDVLSLAVDDDDNIHIHLGPTQDAIAVYDTDGNPLYQYDVANSFDLIGWGGSGHIYLRNPGTTSIKRYSKTGVLLDSPTLGSNYDIVVPGTSLDGYIYAADAADGGVTADFDVYQLNATGTSELNSDSFSVSSGDASFARANWFGTNASSGKVYLWVDTDETVSGVWKFNQNLSGRTEIASSVLQASDSGHSSTAATTDEFALMAKNPGTIHTHNADGTDNTNYLSEADGQIATDSGDGIWWLEASVSPDSAKAHTKDYDGNNAASFDVNLLSQPISETTWHRYPTTTIGDKVSLGIPDGGVSIPALTALEDEIQRKNYVVDLHDAIEAVLVYWKNAVTGNAFNWTPSSADNLYNVAVEPGTYDWKTSGAFGTQVRETFIDEIDLCLTKLEASDLV